MLQVVWFKRDARVVDHRPLASAAAQGPVLPLFIAEPALWAQPDASGRQWAFLAESLAGLRDALAGLGQPLVVRTGVVTEVLGRVQSRFGAFALWSHEETGTLWTYRRDRAVAAWCRDHGVIWTELPQTGVIRRLASRDGWAARWDATMAAPLSRPPALAPLAGVEVGRIPTGRELGLPDDPCPGRQAGGRRAGLAVLDGFLAGRGRVYPKAMSSPLSAATGCSRLSPYLAWGCLSIREVTQAARRRHDGADPAWRRAMTAFVARLHWHCHFIQKLESEPRLEHGNAHRAYDGLRPDPGDDDQAAAWFAAWRQGRTGLPFVDACMRALAATGWINFRMRAMLCSVASYQLWLHWREPSLHLARLFTDYEPGIHYPQMQMQSGTTGINTIRIYNPVKQGRDHDPDGRFIRRWCAELAGFADVHEPWIEGGPAPLVDPIEQARLARERVWAVRRGAGFNAVADAIQDRHGSRRSGLPAPHQARQLALRLE